MELIKKKILLEDYTSRAEANWGELTTDAFYINVMFEHDADDMGIGTEMPFIAADGSTVDYTPLTDKLILSGYTFEFMNGTTVDITETDYSPNTRFTDKGLSDYFIDAGPISGLTEDRIETVRSYLVANPFNPGFNMNRETYTNYNGVSISGITSVTSINNFNPLTYVNDALATDPNIENSLIRDGILFKTWNGVSGNTREVPNPVGGTQVIPITEMYYNGQGFNDTNTHLSATTKDEFLYGVTATPQVYSDIDIDRGANRVIQSHLQLGEIKNMGDLINYGNGFYKIQK